MIIRRLPALALAVAAAGALVVVAGDAVEPTPAVFADLPSPWMANAPTPGALTETWYCAGVPAAGDEGTGGEVLVVNRRDEAAEVRMTWLGPPGQSVTRRFELPAYGRQSIEPGELVTTPFAAAVVEIEGGGGLVEQRAVHPDGTSVSPCANDTSATWYFAEGSTIDGNVEQLLLVNPFQQAVIVDVAVATADGRREPAELQGYPVPAGAVRVVDLSQVARDEAVLAVSVVASRGRLVVARAQHDVGGERRGYSVALGAPAIRDQWWFALGERDASVVERYSISNPGEEDVEVDAVFLGLPLSAGAVDVPTITVPAGETVTFDPADVDALPDGPHSLVFGTPPAQGVVVERAFTRTIDDRPTTSILLGAPPRVGGYVANTWYVGIGPREPTPEALIVFNVDAAPATVSVQRIGRDGPAAVPALTDLRLPAAGLLRIDLTDADVVDVPLVLTSSSRVFVERADRRDEGTAGLSAAWAVPAEA